MNCINKDIHKREFQHSFHEETDKGNVTVASDKEEYIHKIELMLSDKNTYIEIYKDPINNLTTGVRSLLIR